MKLPKYYDSIIQQEDALDMEIRKEKRRKMAKANKRDNTYLRLRVKEKCKKAQTKQIERQENI